MRRGPSLQVQLPMQCCASQAAALSAMRGHVVLSRLHYDELMQAGVIAEMCAQSESADRTLGCNLETGKKKGGEGVC